MDDKPACMEPLLISQMILAHVSIPNSHMGGQQCIVFARTIAQPYEKHNQYFVKI
jgi:hypothetical protein